MKIFFLILFFIVPVSIVPVSIVAQTYLPEVKQLYEWKKEELSAEFIDYQPFYEDIYLPVNLDFYKPNFSEILFLVEKNLLEFDLTQTNQLGITLPKNFSRDKHPNLSTQDIEIIFHSTKAFKKKSGKSQKTGKEKKIELAQAKKILQQLFKNKKTEVVSLWLAWIFYLEADHTQAQQFLDKVYHSSDLKIAIPAEYLQTMLYLKNKEYRKIPLQIKNWQLYYPQVPIPHNLQLASVLAFAKNHNLKAVEESLNLIKILRKNKNHSISQTFALLQAWNYYQQKKYSSSYKILQQLKTQNLNKNLQLDYWKAWSILLAKKTLPRKIKTTLLKKNYPQKKEEMEYLFFLDNLRRTKNPKISLLKKIKDSSFYPHGIIMLLEHKNISKKQKQILYQKYIELDTPELIFYYNTQKADYLRKKSRFNQALQHYLKARNATLLLSENSQKFLFYTNFNIGLLYLRDKKYDKAEKIFFNYQPSLQTDSQDDFQVKNYSTQIWYYLATIYYLQKKAEKILTLPTIKKGKKNKFYKEQFFFRAWAHNQLGNNESARQQIKLAQIHQSSAIQSLIDSQLFKKKKYQKIVQAYNSKKTHSYTSNKLYVASLLKLDKEKKALEYLQKIKKQENPLYIDLYLEVWLANKLFNKVEEFSLQKLQQKTSPEIKFYKNLALVYHQLENWDLSIQYLETIIASILSNPENNLKTVKNVEDNIFLNLIHSTETKHLLYRKNIIANQKKNTLDLWKKTVLLAEQYKRKLEFHQALIIYQDYLKKNTFQKASIQLLNQEILFLQSHWDLCIEYGKEPFFQETLLEKNDREIATNYCSLRQNKTIFFPIPQQLDYRKNSWLFLKAIIATQGSENRTQIFSNKISTKELNPIEQQRYRLLKATNQLKKKEFVNALNSLKKAQNYIYFPTNYTQKLFLETQIYLNLERKKEALSSLIKLIYSPLEKKTRITFILTAVELLIEQEWQEEAQLLFISINPKDLSTQNQERYNKIKLKFVEKF